MKTSMKTMSAAVLSVAALITLSPASAHDAGPGQEKRALLQVKPLPDAPGKQAVMATVSYAPGQESIPHEHPGSVFAYVREGSVTSQLEGGPLVTYKAGDSWYEPPRAHHIVSNNASKTKPAVLLVFLLMNEGEEIARPLPATK